MKVLLMESRDITEGQNIALGYLAASLKKNGIEVVCLSEANLRNYPPDLLEKYIINTHKPDLIGINMFYSSYYLVHDMIKRIKTYYDKPIMVGGPQMNIEGDKILKDFPELDYAMVGEAEYSLVNFCQTMENGGDFSKVNGLIWKNDKGEIITNPPQENEKDLDSIPFPSYDEFGIEKMSTYTLMTARGCPYSCHFCFRSTRHWRARSPENIIEEIAYAKERFKAKAFRIVDDSFNLQPKRVIEFCKLLMESEINLPWSLTGVRLDKVPDEMIVALRDSKCEKINCGIETLQEDVFNSINKGETLDQVRDSIKRLNQHGIKTYGNFIVGLVGDTADKTWDTYKQAKKLGLTGLSFTLLLPFPGTKLYDEIYSRPDVNRLRDYKEANLYWFNSPTHSILSSAFELPDYPEREKLSMYHRLWVHENYPKPRHHKSLLIMGLRALGLIMKYDALRFPYRVWKLVDFFRKRIKRSHSGKLSFEDTVLRKGYVPTVDELVQMYGPSQMSSDG